MRVIEAAALVGCGLDIDGGVMRWMMMVAVLLLGGVAEGADEARGVEIEKRDVVVKHRTFDPKNPPSEMPPLEPPEAAVTHAQFGIETSLVAEVDPASPNVIKVEKITSRVTLEITIWLPLRATAALKEHEEGHRRISEMFYKDAEKVLREAAGPFVGKRVGNRGGSDAAMKDVIQQVSGKYMAQVQVPAGKVNELFDEITDYGRNKVAVEKAIEQAMERHRRQR